MTEHDLPDVIYAKEYIDSKDEGAWWTVNPPAVNATKYISEASHLAAIAELEDKYQKEIERLNYEIGVKNGKLLQHRDEIKEIMYQARQHFRGFPVALKAFEQRTGES